MISRIKDKSELAECVPLIRAAFQTVADEFHLTPENCPTNPAFITTAAIETLFDNGVELYLLRKDHKPAGFVAIEKSPKEEGTFYIEKLAVHPDQRHRGTGRELMDFAMQRIHELGGKRISIALIDANTRLKDWYRDQGFVETGTKDFPQLPFRVCFMELILS